MKQSTTLFIAGTIIFIILLFFILTLNMENYIGILFVLIIFGGYFFIRGTIIFDYEEEDDYKTKKEKKNPM